MPPQETKLNKLQEILKMMDENISREEFVKSFEAAMIYIKNFQEKMQREHDAMMQMMAKKISAIKEGTDGKDGADGKDGKDGLPGKDGKDGKPGKDGRDGQAGKNADTNAIVKSILKQIDMKPLYDAMNKKLNEYDGKIKAIPERPVTTIFGPGKTKVRLVDISAKLDGSTKTFTLPTNFGIVGVYSSAAPFTFRPTIDYKEAGKTIVFDAAIDAPSMLASGQTIIIQYVR